MSRPLGGFNYAKPSAYSYHVVDPKKYRFSQTASYRPPTPPLYQPPAHPGEEAKKEEPKVEEAAEGAAEGETSEREFIVKLLL